MPLHETLNAKNLKPVKDSNFVLLYFLLVKAFWKSEKFSSISVLSTPATACSSLFFSSEMVY